jgi:general nucleoside transport system ATP-binding protein
MIAVAGLTKRFGSLAANDDVTLSVERGGIHAIVGENGAGKSTLLHLIYGELRPDAGRLTIGGVDVPLATHNPAGAIARGVGLVHQHFMLVPTLTVAENVVLGREPVHRGALDRARAEREVAEVAASAELTVEPRRRVADLTVGEQQRVEILKALWRGAEVLLLDEPTAVLSPPEVKELFRVLRALRDAGKTVVLVTHKLDEVTAIADATTVMRGGRVVASLPKGTPPGEIAKAIVGGHNIVEAARQPTAPGEVLLDVEDLAGGRLAGASLAVRKGEIVGIAGVQGNGQTELVLAVAGLLAPSRGRVLLGGNDVTRASVGARLARGLGHIPDDRHRRGVVLGFSLADNLRLGRQRELGQAGLEAFATARLTAADVRPPDANAVIQTLSGGNQQKLVVERELGRPGLRVLLAAEPTRGVDIGAAAAIHARILAAAGAGVGVLLVSSDLAELRRLADRLLVFFRGRIAAELAPSASDEELGALMTGAAA